MAYVSIILSAKDLTCSLLPKPKIAQVIIALDSWKWHLKENNQENQFFDWMVAKGQA